MGYVCYSGLVHPGESYLHSIHNHFFKMAYGCYRGSLATVAKATFIASITILLKWPMVVIVAA
jgi:hypothetical protein